MSEGLVLLARDAAIVTLILNRPQTHNALADLPLAAGLAHEVLNGAGIGPDFAERVSGQFQK